MAENAVSTSTQRPQWGGCADIDTREKDCDPMQSENAPARYVVIGPEREYNEWVPGVPGPGPSYPTQDCLLVDADTAAAAKWAAWGRAKRLRLAWFTNIEDDHPLKGVRCERTTDETPTHWGDHYVDARSYL